MSIYVVTGTDEGRVSEEATALFEKLKAPNSDEFTNEIIEGAADNAESAFQKSAQAIEALQTLGFFGGEKVVWLKSATFFGTDRTSEAERALTGVENLLEVLQGGLPPGVTFLLSATGINGVRRFGKWAKKNSDYRSYDRIDVSKEGWEDQVATVVMRVAREMGLTLEPEALDLFVQRAGADTRQITNELAKLDLYLGERREVSVEDVTLMVSVSHKGVIWEISRAVERRNAKRAIELIDSLLEKNENAVGMIKASIIPTVRNLFYAKLVDSYEGGLNQLPAGVQAVLPKKKDGSINTWGLKMAARGARNFTLDQLQAAMSHCLAADKALVTSGQDHRMVLHKLVIQLCDGKRAA